MNLFSDAMRRDPFPTYDQLRAVSPVLHVPPFNAWLLFDYESVKHALGDHESFSSQIPAPKNLFIFFDPPRHTRLRALIARAFTPRAVANLEPRIRELSRGLLHRSIERGAMDLCAEFSGPLPMMVIVGMLGLPLDEVPRCQRWSDEMLKLSHSLFRGEEESRAVESFRAATEEMRVEVHRLLSERRAAPRDDMLTRLTEAEVDGERLTDEEILGFFQLLLIGGQETTTNLINNALLCLFEHPDQFARLRAAPELLPTMIEEVVRYRSPLQWVMRTPKKDVTLHGQLIRPGQLVLPIIGSANRDPQQFTEPGRFDMTREPNPHLAFGHGLHFCLGAPLARLEARIALGDIIERLQGLERDVAEPWTPRPALNVYGPTRLPVRFNPAPARRVSEGFPR